MKGVFRRGRYWWISYSKDGRSVRESTGLKIEMRCEDPASGEIISSQKMAEGVLNKRKAEIFLNTHNVQRDRKVKFEDLCDELLARHCQHKKGKKKFYDVVIRELKTKFGTLYLSQITQEIIERYRDERLRRVAPATVNRSLAVLKLLFNKGKEWRRFDGENPVRFVKFLTEPDGRTRYLHPEEVEKLIKCAQERLKPILITAVGTGLRRGNILALKWTDVDFRNSIIYINKLTNKGGKRLEIPLSEDVKNALISVRKRPDSPYIFSIKEGALDRAFEKALEKAEIDDFRFHDLRHTAASNLVLQGVDLYTVKEILGHSTIKVTERYSHLSQDHKRRAIMALDGLFGTHTGIKRHQHSKNFTNFAQSEKAQNSERNNGLVSAATQ